MKNTASVTVKRASALVAIAGALLATTGCTYTNQPATTIVYSASDGQMANLLGENNQQDIQLATSWSLQPMRPHRAVCWAPF